jgi:hypothetical protein
MKFLNTLVAGGVVLVALPMLHHLIFVALTAPALVSAASGGASAEFGAIGEAWYWASVASGVALLISAVVLGRNSLGATATCGAGPHEPVAQSRANG